MVDEKIPKIETELTVLKADPKDRTIKFSVYGYIEDGSEPDYDAEVLESTEVADRYRSNHVVAYEEPDSTSSLCLDVLPDLWGEPWDQCALNFVHSLRPSGIRVNVGGGGTLDSQTWRVTVALEKDNRTIRSITQEVAVGCTGCKHGHGLRRYTIGESPEPVLGYYNPNGLERLEIYRGGPGAEDEGHHPDTTPAGRALLNQAADEHLMEILDEMDPDEWA